MLPLLTTLLACVDYDVNGKPDDPGLADTDTPADTDDTPPEDTAETAAPPPVEECNGEDDDGDGLTDEDFADTDADGTADCRDDACELDTRTAGKVDRGEACVATTVADAWSSRVLWQWSSLSTDSDLNSVAVTPLVAQVTDDDGDGDLDADDDVDVVFVAIGSAAARRSDAWIVALDGATGAEHFVLLGVSQATELAIGDLDADGVPELLAYDDRNALHAWHTDGTELWATASLTAYIGGMPAVAVVDLDGDGAPEVLAQEYVLTGATGEVRTTLGVSPVYAQHAAGDVYLDGGAEIVYDGALYTADGMELWSSSGSSGSGDLVYAMILDADGDVEGEVVLVGTGWMEVHEPDGTLIASGSWAPRVPGVPCAADLDADGTPEVVVPGMDALRMLELDGTVVWEAPISDTSSAAGCVAADLDRDGAAEVIFADEVDLSVYDGRTGARLLTWTEHASGTMIETPTVADIDADGAMEIILGSNDNMMPDLWTGITVLEHDGGGWASGPTSWMANARVDGRFSDNGTVLEPGSWWSRENTYRGVATADADWMADATVAIVDVCVASCEAEGVASVSVEVANAGPSTLAAGVPVRIYAVESGARTLIAETETPAEIASGASADSLVIEIPSAALGGEGIVVTVNEDVEDCNPDDNEATWTDDGCP